MLTSNQYEEFLDKKESQSLKSSRPNSDDYHKAKIFKMKRA